MTLIFQHGHYCDWGIKNIERGLTMKAKVFSLSLLSMIATPNGEAMEDGGDRPISTVGQALYSLYEVIKKPDIIYTLTGEKEEAQVQAAIADSLLPDLMRQKADVEAQATVALSFLSALGFQIEENAPLPLDQQVQNYIQAKEEKEASYRAVERRLLEMTQELDETKRQLAEAVQAEEKRKAEFSSLLEKKQAEAESAQASQEVAYMAMENKLAEMTKERDEKKNQLVQMIEEQVDTKDVITGEAFSTNLVQTTDFTELTFQTLPLEARANQASFFAYLDTFKNGQNNETIEKTKQKYESWGGGHRAKLNQAITYLKIAQITTNQVTEQLTKVHQAEMEATRIAMEKKLAEVIQERVSTNEVALSIGREFATNIANLTVLTLPIHAKPNQSTFFEYLDSLKNGQNELLLEETKEAYNAETRPHPSKILAAITYLKIAAQLTERLTKVHQAIMMEKKSVERGQGQPNIN